MGHLSISRPSNCSWSQSSLWVIVLVAPCPGITILRKLSSIIHPIAGPTAIIIAPKQRTPLYHIRHSPGPPENERHRMKKVFSNFLSSIIPVSFHKPSTWMTLTLKNSTRTDGAHFLSIRMANVWRNVISIAGNNLRSIIRSIGEIKRSRCCSNYFQRWWPMPANTIERIALCPYVSAHSNGIWGIPKTFGINIGILKHKGRNCAEGVEC